MVSRSDFMRIETEHPLYLVNDIAKQTTVEGIVDACKRLPALIASQISADADGEQLGKDYRLGHAAALPYRRIRAGLATLYLRLGSLGIAGSPRTVGAQRPGQCARAGRFCRGSG
jgi:hypothetical protein